MKRISWQLNKASLPNQKVLLFLFLLVITLGLTWTFAKTQKENATIMVMGGSLQAQSLGCEDSFSCDQNNLETFFRPSQLPVLNTRFSSSDFFDSYFEKEPSEISLPDDLMDTPENTILNYFSILRDAANPVEKKSSGCGTIGNGKIPYPVSYQFLSEQYQKNLSYDAYLKTYENILHINLIKYHQIPPKAPQEDTIRYFIELETIEGTERETGAFSYYYGFVDLEKEGTQYKITDMHYFGENFLCAPYHGWQWDAQANVEIRYGDWCNLINGEVQLTQNDDIIRVLFDGTDGYQYCIVFFQLTNGTDLEVAQYRRIPMGSWKPIHMNLEDCLENKKRAFSFVT